MKGMSPLSSLSAVLLMTALFTSAPAAADVFMCRARQKQVEIDLKALYVAQASHRMELGGYSKDIAKLGWAPRAKKGGYQYRILKADKDAFAAEARGRYLDREDVWVVNHAREIQNIADACAPFGPLPAYSDPLPAIATSGANQPKASGAAEKAEAFVRAAYRTAEEKVGSSRAELKKRASRLGEGGCESDKEESRTVAGQYDEVVRCSYEGVDLRFRVAGGSEQREELIISRPELLPQGPVQLRMTYAALVSALGAPRPHSRYETGAIYCAPDESTKAKRERCVHLILEADEDEGLIVKAALFRDGRD